MAVLDPDVAAVLEERSEWRRKGLRVLLGRIAKQAGPKRTLQQVTRMVQQLAQRVLA